MLYHLLKIPAAISFWMYCRKLHISDKSILSSNGPLLIACNHPNSFLDAIVLSSIFKRPVHSLARGDVFRNKFFDFLLRSLHMLPVYRSSEGVQNMEENYTSFEACKNIFKENGIVLIFSEGRCVNEWKLRPLMKGTARLALSSWEEGIDLKILPTGINYQSFTSFGKNIHLHFGAIISKEDVHTQNGFGKSVASFNEILYSRLQQLVYVMDSNDLLSLRQQFNVPVSMLKKTLLAIPAAAGYLLHFAPGYAAKTLAGKYGGSNDHYDSIFVAIVFVTYPFYLLIISLVLFQLQLSYWWACFVLLPFCAWSYMQVKKQF